MQTLILQHDYPVRPARLWAIATDYAALGRAMARAAEGARSPAHAATGQVLRIRIPLMGVLRPHLVRIALCDDARMILRASEGGEAGHRWALTLAVTPAGEGSRLTERVELDAGFLNPILSVWVRRHYALRHALRLRLIEDADR